MKNLMKIILIVLGAVVVLTIIGYIVGAGVYFNVKTTGNISNNVTNVLTQENENCNV